MIGMLNSLISCFILAYVVSKILKTDIQYKSLKFLIGITVSAILLELSSRVINNYFTLILNFLIAFTLIKIVFFKPWITTIFVSFVSFILIGIADTIFGMFYTFVLGMSVSEFSGTSLQQLKNNIILGLTVVTISNVKYLGNKLSFIIESVHIKNFKSILITSFLVVLICTLIMYNSYYNINIFVTFILSVFMIITFFILGIVVVKEKGENAKKELENEMLVNNLSEYERMLESNLITNHENKNSLIVIKSMIGSKNKKAIEYIDTLISDKYTDDESILYRTRKFPIGGLQGLIYQKMLIMKSNNITFHLEVGREINKNSFKNMDSKTHYDVCTIISIYLDNAIEAVKELKKKNISMCAYIENGDVHISISNNFKGFVDIDKIDEKGYSTKGKNRGFGLSIVKKTIEENSKLSFSREIISDMFKQVLKLKL